MTPPDLQRPVATRRFAAEAFVWLLLAALLTFGLPLFVAMPPWVDVTYHDISARNVMIGGVHYRDVFETNLPGMVWHHALVRSLFGWSSEAMRIADVVVVGCAILLIGAWLSRIGVSRVARLWFVFAAAFFYLGGTEFIHCQRDGWMLLPVVIALHLRGRQVVRVDVPGVTRGGVFAASVLEGLFWGWAVWIKPHALVIALVLWLISARRIAGGIPRRSGLIDLLGLLLGGLIAGAAGSAWLVATGAWPHLWDVLLHWNPDYYDWSGEAMYERVKLLFMHFAPWSLIHAVSVPVGLYSLWRARFWRKNDLGSDEARLMSRALLAAAYLGWLAEATFLQKPFPYAHAPAVILALAVLTAHRWPVGPILLGWCVAGSMLHLWSKSNETIRSALTAFHNVKPYTFQQVVPLHPLLEPDRLALWGRSVREGATPELKDRLTCYGDIFCVVNWQELDQVAGYLRTLNLKEGELVCWYDATHPLYLQLGLRPTLRFIHVTTALSFKNRIDDIRRELIGTGHRYVVSDLAVVRKFWIFDMAAPPGQPNALPEDFPDEVRDVYPWDQPILFRTNRYTVHEVRYPIQKVWFAPPKQPEPGQ